MHKVAIFGDHFVRCEILQQQMQQHVEPILGALAYETYVMGYPYVAAANQAALREFIGDPDEIAGALVDVEIVVDHMAPITRPVIARDEAADHRQLPD